VAVLLLAFANLALIVRLYAQTPESCAVPTTSTIAGGSVNASIGQEFAVVLMSQPGTGYSWSVTTDPDPSIAVALDSVALPPATSLLGAPGRQCFRFMATGAGDTQVGFSYARPFESGVPPAQHVDVQVSVAAASGVRVPVQVPRE